jgi:hypothetical protein
MGNISLQIKPVSFQKIQINVLEQSQQRKKKIMLSVPPNEDIKLFVSNQLSGRNSPAGTPFAKDLISQRVIGNDYADLSHEMGDEDTGSGRTTKNVMAHPQHRKIYSLAPPKLREDRRSSTVGP